MAACRYLNFNLFVMIEKMKSRNVKLKWMNGIPPVMKRVALLIPQYNEGKNFDLLHRLNYFMSLAKEHKTWMDVILIDDGSTDSSFLQIESFVREHPDAFYFASVKPNAMKVGALYLVSEAVKHEYVILSDFDTDLLHLSNLPASLDILDKDLRQIGCYFKMIPFSGSGSCFRLQQLEYSFARMYYKFHRKDNSVPVMPGAGSCFKRELLLEVYAFHSGLRNGEDREATILALKMGMETMYTKDVLALTRPPLTFRTLLTQRNRWYLGYIETFLKEKEFYMKMLVRFKRIGLRTLQDALGIVGLLLLPLEILLVSLISIKFAIYALIGVYLTSVSYYFLLFLSNRDERIEIKGRNVQLIVIYPLFWLLISFLAWWNAAMAYRRKIGKKEDGQGVVIALRNQDQDLLLEEAANEN